MLLFFIFFINRWMLGGLVTDDMPFHIHSLIHVLDVLAEGLPATAVEPTVIRLELVDMIFKRVDEGVTPTHCIYKMILELY